jgi:sugar lactone lactonase YvrE
MRIAARSFSGVVLQRVTLLGLLALVLLAFTGCGAPRAVAHKEAVFFPPPPDLPRIQFLTSFSSSPEMEGQKGWQFFASADASEDQERFLVKPFGITGHAGKLYVVDTLSANIAVIDPAAKRFTYLPGNAGAGRAKKPVNLATDAAGNLYVADTERKEVLCYGPEGNFLRTFGKELDIKPVDVAVYGNDLFILNFANSDIKILDRKSGKLVGTIGKQSADPQEQLSLPTNMASSSRGALYVANVTSGKVIKLDRDGHFLGAFGKLGTGFGQFGRPRGVAVDDQERVYVVDVEHQNVQLFDEKFRLLMFFGSNAGDVSMNLPAGIYISKDLLDVYQQYAAPGFQLEQVIFVTNQVGPHKVAVYGMGKQVDLDYDTFDAETRRLREQKSVPAESPKTR